jgi:lipopolysaccharide biosynthesis glycosyltransferase
MPVALALRVDRVDETTADSLRALATGGPIGCEDWSTVYLALNVGVEAYYSGPLVPRVGRDTSGDRIAAVTDVCATTVREGAVDRIPDRLRRLCEPYVREARGRAHVHLPTPRPVDALACEAGSLSDQSSEGLIDIAVAFDAALVAHVAPMLQSLASSTRTALRVFCFVRGVSTRQTTAIARRFPEIRFRFIDMGRVDYEGTFHFFGHVTMSTMDRLLLPLVLPNVTRLIYLDTDLVVIDAIDDLWFSQTGGAGIAARPLEHPSWSPLHRLTEHIAHRRRAPAALDEIRREMAARFDLGARAFNAGVLVMALDRLRDARFSDETLDLSRRHSLNDNEAMALWANGRFTALADRWNCIPGIEFQESPAVIHWAGPMKPWRRGEYVPHREVWQRFARAAARR